jgi:hypothetical protein
VSKCCYFTSIYCPTGVAAFLTHLPMYAYFSINSNLLFASVHCSHCHLLCIPCAKLEATDYKQKLHSNHWRMHHFVTFSWSKAQKSYGERSNPSPYPFPVGGTPPHTLHLGAFRGVRRLVSNAFGSRYSPPLFISYLEHWLDCVNI